MARPHIEFIFAQHLPWTPAVGTPGRETLNCKRLSADNDSGELSVILECRAGWRQRVSGEFEEELYVIDGEIEIAQRQLARDAYARLPPRCNLQWHSRAGAIVLIMFNRATQGANSFPIAPVFIDTTQQQWDRSGVPRELDYMGIARKALHVDADTGRHRTWLLTTAPQIAPRGLECRRETHGCAEEMFMLAGDITGPHGRMTPGAYFWRPRETLHGPFGSRDGNLALLRFRDGEQTTIFHDETLPFSFEAPYQPNLPQELARFSACIEAPTGRF